MPPRIPSRRRLLCQGSDPQGASAQSFPLIFKRLLEVEANYFICTEWKKQDPAKSRSLIHSRRRHFHNTKRSFASYVDEFRSAASAAKMCSIDESKEAQVHDLGEALKEIEIKGNYFGEYSLSVVVYDRDLAKVESACAEFYKAFSIHDAQLYEEKIQPLQRLSGGRSRQPCLQSARRCSSSTRTTPITRCCSPCIPATTLMLT